MPVDAVILSQVLESHDRLLGVIDADDGLVGCNTRARELLIPAAERMQRATAAPRALIDAADESRSFGVVRRALLVRTGDGAEHFLHGHFWPLENGHVGFALRTDGTASSAEVASALGVPPWRAQKALQAAQRLSFHDIAAALAAGGGDVTECISRLAAAPVRSSACLPLPSGVATHPNRVEIEPPAALPHGVAPLSNAPVEPPPHAARVLCVLGDSEHAYGERLSRMLEDLGHEPCRVMRAADAREALDLTSSYFHTVLLNLDMPGGETLELASAIREAHPDARVSFYTDGGSSEESVERARRLAPVLPAPKRVDEVRRAVAHATRGEPARRRPRRFASGSRPSMKIRSILTALRRGRG
jgi:CheY-like chemotaxis protein